MQGKNALKIHAQYLSVYFLRKLVFLGPKNTSIFRKFPNFYVLRKGKKGGKLFKGGNCLREDTTQGNTVSIPDLLTVVFIYFVTQ